MEKTFEGKTYETIPEIHKSSCLECVATGINLCETLRADNVCADNKVIWREKVIQIVPIAKNEYETAAKLFIEWRDSDSRLEFNVWCNQKADPEYDEYQRLKAKFQRK
jgi:hypothetical protein